MDATDLEARIVANYIGTARRILSDSDPNPALSADHYAGDDPAVLAVAAMLQTEYHHLGPRP